MAVGTCEANFIKIHTSSPESALYQIASHAVSIRANQRLNVKGLPLNIIEQSVDDELMRTYGTPAHMCCATSTAWKQVGNAETPKTLTATGSSNTFPGSKSFAAPKQSSHQFWGILSLSQSFYVFLPCCGLLWGLMGLPKVGMTKV